jgi:hypothetical protein
MVDVLVIRDQIAGSLHHAISSGTHGLSSVPGLLRRAIVEEVWKERTVRATNETIPAFPSFRAFVETVLPDGLGAKLDLIERIIRDDPEVLEMFRSITTGQKHIHKTDGDNITIKPERGTSRPYILSRLKRSNPELFAKVVAGEMSANAAAIDAGFKKKPTPFEQVMKLLPKLTADEHQQLVAHLSGRDAA